MALVGVVGSALAVSQSIVRSGRGRRNRPSRPTRQDQPTAATR